MLKCEKCNLEWEDDDNSHALSEIKLDCAYQVKQPDDTWLINRVDFTTRLCETCTPPVAQKLVEAKDLL